MMTNQSVVVFDGLRVAVGFRVNTGVDVKGARFGGLVERPGIVCDDPNAGGSFGYTLLPFIGGGVLGDFTIENGAVTFVLQNAATKDGTGWGVGPLTSCADAHWHGQLRCCWRWTRTTCMYSTPRSLPGAVVRLHRVLVLGDDRHRRQSRAPGSCRLYPGQPHGVAGEFDHGLDPTTAWTAGQHVVLGDGSKALDWYRLGRCLSAT